MAEEPLVDGVVGTPPAGFEGLRTVADAVLYEGYLLYPYRRSSSKNRVRWQFGVLAPRPWIEADGPVSHGLAGSAESWFQQTECLLEAAPETELCIRVRYLQLQRKSVERRTPDGRYEPVDSLELDGVLHLSFDEAVPQEADIAVPLGELLAGEHTVAVGAPGGEQVAPLADGAGRVVRTREAVRAEASLRAEPLDGPRSAYRLRIRTENTDRECPPRARRDEALRRALLATHTFLGCPADGGARFVSLLDPPTWAEEHVRACRNLHTFPVLAGPEGGARLVLSAPIILPDHPQVAPESPGDLHDATEIDEILSLRTALLTDDEKREARATDERAAAILDRVDTMPPEIFSRLHGAIRSLRPHPAPEPAEPAPATPRPAGPGGGLAGPAGGLAAAPPAGTEPGPAGPRDSVPWWQERGDEGLSPTTDTVLVDGTEVARGSRVLLRPAGRGSDAQDMFLSGRTALVAAVFEGVDGGRQVAVTLEDDPGAELNTWYGRYHYFRPHEIQPLTAADEEGSDGRSRALDA